MSRAKSRIQTDVCGDCSSADPSWASINRGILLCADCCSIHRSLGRHISQVKSLRQGSWQPSVLNFVNQLNAHGANSVWEHLLLDSAAPKNLKRKPTPKDAVHPTKTDFIRAKHVQLAFVLKPTFQAEEGSSLELELSKQLHASVRAGNLETSLRLLVQGADPNFYHEDKGSTPLHVAVKSGQLSQIELLLVYGADVNALDAQGNTPLDLARQAKHSVIAERLLEVMYEVTDRLTFFLIGKKPNHASGQHLLIPGQSKKEMSEQLKIARGKLQLVPNRMFEELVMDLYDEVDRRETEAIWATSALNPDSGAVPFLPTNPHLSATRNQGRQKLARFSQQEFAGLLMDVLLDAHRRQNMANLRPIDGPLPVGLAQLKAASLGATGGGGIRDSNLSDDEPLYDAVASDDDYAALAPVAQQALVNKSSPAAVSNVEVETLRQRIQDQELTIHELRSMVQKLASENNQLKSTIDTKEHEVQLRIDSHLNGSLASEGSPERDPNNQEAKQAAAAAAAAYAKRPVSMYETRQTPRDESRPPITQSLYSMAPPAPGGNMDTTPPSNGGTPLPSFEEALVNKSSPAAVSNVEVETLRQRIQDQELTIHELRSMVQKLASENNQLKSTIDTKEHEVQLRIDSHLNGSLASEGSPERDPNNQEAKQAAAAAAAAYAKRPVSMYETRQTPRDESRPPITQSLYSMAPPAPGGNMDTTPPSNGGTPLPSFEEVKHRTNLVARRMKELYAAMKDLSQREAFVPSAERIRLAVADLLALFPASLNVSDSLRGTLQQVNFHANLIQAECARLQQCLAAESEMVPNGGPPGTGKPLAESIQQSMEQVRVCTYDLAMATKILLNHLQPS
uniref:Arf-GAP domain-containing protein n=1 Tax=Anopheles culicifacies TaxID=139723 RepID=A0A182LXY4_9DIPT